MKPLIHVSGPSDSGPGERRQMLDRAAQVFTDAEVDPSAVIRIDIPGRGQSKSGEANIRPEVEPVVPALQSGSLFGEKIGLMVVDAHQLRKPEAAVVAELLNSHPDPAGRQVVLVSAGRLPAPLPAYIKKHGQKVTVKKLRERDTAAWLRETARDRGLRLRPDARDVLLERFGSDIGSLGQALTQLAEVDGPITGDLVRDRFSNRPDEPMWHLTDAAGKGSVDEALRRLHDLLTHNHPLVLLTVIENDLRRKAMAAAAPDIKTFARWIDAKPEAYPTRKAWQARRRTDEGNLKLASDALLRADGILKAMPEETHLVTMERLVVSLCYWYGR